MWGTWTFKWDMDYLDKFRRFSNTAVVIVFVYAVVIVKSSSGKSMLDVLNHADDHTIRSHARRKSLQTHADRGGAVRLFRALQDAKDLLLDPELRTAFDAQGWVE